MAKVNAGAVVRVKFVVGAVQPDAAAADVLEIKVPEHQLVTGALAGPGLEVEPPPGPLPKINDQGIELGAAMDARTDDLDVLAVLNQALKYERGFGGAGIFIGADDGVDDLTKPLDENRIRSIRHLTPYFGGYDGSEGELYVYDPGTGTTAKVDDIHPGADLTNGGFGA